MSKQCPKCSTDGYCHELHHHRCTLKHTPDCSKGAACFNPKCYAMHPVPMCQLYKACKTFECTFRHSKNRTWKCRNGASCVDEMCQSLHPATATAASGQSQGCGGGNLQLAARAGSKANDTKPKKNINIKPKLEPPSKNQPIVNEKGTSTHSKSCLSAEQCVNVSCTFSHPLTRPPLCPDGALCVSSLCLRLHPPQALEQRLLKKATHGLGGQFKAISAPRKAHKNKLSAVTLQSFQLLQQAPEQVITKNIKT